MLSGSEAQDITLAFRPKFPASANTFLNKKLLNGIGFEALAIGADP